VIIEVFLICVLNYYDEVGVINLDGLGDWLMYEDDGTDEQTQILQPYKQSSITASETSDSF